RHRARSLHVEGRLLRLDDRAQNRHGTLGAGSRSDQRPARVPLPDQRHVGIPLSDQRRRPAGQGQRDERDPEVEQLERSTDVAASTGRTRRTGIPLGKPLQTACSALQKSLFRHGSGLRVRLVRLRAPSTPQLPHIRISSEIALLRTCPQTGDGIGRCGQIGRTLAEEPTALNRPLPPRSYLRPEKTAESTTRRRPFTSTRYWNRQPSTSRSMTLPKSEGHISLSAGIVSRVPPISRSRACSSASRSRGTLSNGLAISILNTGRILHDICLGGRASRCRCPAWVPPLGGNGSEPLVFSTGDDEAD